MTLWKHQTLAVEAARKHPHLALFYDIGTGKTRTTVEILREEYNRRRGLVKTLILAPLAVCPQWKKEFLATTKIPEGKIAVLTGSGKDRVKEFERLAFYGEPFVVITNYQGMLMKDFGAKLLAWKPVVAIADECHRLKDASSKTSVAAYKLTADCERRFMLTGTPVPNSLLDIFGQYRFLDPSVFGKGFWSFRGRFFYDRNAGKKFAYPDWVPFPKAAEQIGQTIKATSLQAKRDECLDLPPLQVIKVPVQMAKDQDRAYKAMKRDFLTVVKDKVVTAEFAMTKTVRMQQILAGFAQPDESDKPVFFEDQPRLDALMEILDTCRDKKVIVWTTFAPTYDQIGKRLEKEGFTYAYLTGEQTISQKNHSVETFCRGETQVLVANPAAGGEGLNLQESSVSVYYLRGYNRVHYEQSAGRNYRGGSERHDKVLHYHLMAEATLDEVIADALLAKKSVSDAVMNWALDNGKSNE